MKRVTPAGWLALGTALVGGGFTLGVAYWIFTLGNSGGRAFWEVPGFISVGLAVIGALALGLGLFRKDESTESRPARRRVGARDCDSVVLQRTTTAPGGQTTQVANVKSEGDITIAPEQRNG
jgi:hypothetical protein